MTARTTTEQRAAREYAELGRRLARLEGFGRDMRKHLEWLEAQIDQTRTALTSSAIADLAKANDHAAAAVIDQIALERAAQARAAR